jgi:hypothetical protein
LSGVLWVASALVLTATLAGCSFLPVDAVPLRPGARECIAMPQAVCNQVALSQQESRPGFSISGYRMRCKTTCTQAEGEAELLLLWSDGSTEQSGYFWAGKPEPAAT